MHWLRSIFKKSLFLLPACVLLILWEVAVHGSPARLFLFGSPSLIFETAMQEYRLLSFWLDVAITALEAMLGLIIGATCGVLVAFLLWMRPGIQKIARPYIALLGAVPVFALAPMLVIWFGVGLAAKVFMAAIGVFFLSLIQTYEGITTTATQHIEHARQMHAKPRHVFSKILLPSATRWLLTALNMSVGVALLGAFIAEFISSQAGLGHYILKAGQVYDMPTAIFGVMNLAFLALTFDAVIKLTVPKRFLLA